MNRTKTYLSTEDVIFVLAKITAEIYRFQDGEYKDGAMDAVENMLKPFSDLLGETLDDLRQDLLIRAAKFVLDEIVTIAPPPSRPMSRSEFKRLHNGEIEESYGRYRWACTCGGKGKWMPSSGAAWKGFFRHTNRAAAKGIR